MPPARTAHWWSFKCARTSPPMGSWDARQYDREWRPRIQAVKFIDAYRANWSALVSEYGSARTLAAARKLCARGDVIHREGSNSIGLYRGLHALVCEWPLPGGAVDPANLADFGAPPHDARILGYTRWAVPGDVLRTHQRWGGTGAPQPTLGPDDFHPWGPWITADIDLEQPNSEIIRAIEIERHRRNIRLRKRPARAAGTWHTCLAPGFEMLRIRELDPGVAPHDIATSVLGPGHDRDSAVRVARRCMHHARAWIKRVEGEHRERCGAPDT